MSLEEAINLIAGSSGPTILDAFVVLGLIAATIIVIGFFLFALIEKLRGKL